MLHCLSGSDAIGRIASKHFVQQIKALFIKVGHELVERPYCMIFHLLHILFEEGQLVQAWPLLICWSAADLEYFVQLVAVIVSLKQWRPVDDLRKNAANRPDVNTCRVVLGAQ